MLTDECDNRDAKNDPALEAFMRGYRTALKELNADMLAALKKARAHLNREEDADDLAEVLEAIETAIDQATDPSATA